MKTLNFLATSVLLATSISAANAGQLTHVDTDGISGVKTQYFGIKSGKTEIGRYTMQDAQGNKIQAFGLDTLKFGNPGNYNTTDWLSSGITDKIDYLFEKYLPTTTTSEDNGLFGMALLEIVWDGLFANSVETGFFQIASGLTANQITTVNGMIQDVQANYGNNNYDRYDLTYHTGTYKGPWNIDFPARSLVTWTEKVPEPATVLLLGLGLLAMAFATSKLDRITSILKAFPNHRFTVSQIARMPGVVYEDVYSGKNLEQRCGIIYFTMRNRLVQGKPGHVFQDDVGYRKYWFDPDNIHIPSREEKVAAIIEDETKEQEHIEEEEEEEEITDALGPIEYVLPEDRAIAEPLQEPVPEEKKSIWKKIFE